jgi:hypothetical protein
MQHNTESWLLFIPSCSSEPVPPSYFSSCGLCQKLGRHNWLPLTLTSCIYIYQQILFSLSPKYILFSSTCCQQCHCPKSDLSLTWMTLSLCVWFPVQSIVHSVATAHSSPIGSPLWPASLWVLTPCYSVSIFYTSALRFLCLCQHTVFFPTSGLTVTVPSA